MIRSYKELPIGKYLRIMDLCENRDMDEIDRQIAIVSILSDRSEDELLSMPIGEYKALSAGSAFLQDECQPMKRMPKSIRLGEWELMPTTDITKLTTAQYIDFQSFSSEGRSRYCEMLSCFLVPKGMQYNEGYDIVQLQEDLRNGLSVEVATTLSAFFLSRLLRSIRSSLTYSKWIVRGMKASREKERLKEQIERMKAVLERSGAGWIMSAMLPGRPTPLGSRYGG